MRRESRRGPSNWCLRGVHPGANASLIIYAFIHVNSISKVTGTDE